MATRDDALKGMSLRDYFAAKALQGMLTHGFLPAMAEQDTAQGYDWPKAAYKMADAMLAERSK